MNRDRNQGSGCLTSLLQLFLLRKAYEFGQEHFGSKRGGCCGCVIGVILFLAFIYFALRIIFNIDLTSLI